MKKFWNIIKIVSPIIGITSLLLAIYIHFIRPNNPEVVLEILNNSSLVDIKDDYQKIKILYDSIDLLKSKKELLFIIIKVTNTGNIDINLSHLDPNNPLGIKIYSGTIIETPRISNSSDTYLTDYPKIIQNSPSSFYFQNFLFDHNSFFIIKFVALHDIDTPVIIKPIGKISGYDPKIIDNYLALKNDRGLFQIIFDGDFWVLLLKVIIFTLIGIGIGIIIGIIVYNIKRLLFPEPPNIPLGQAFGGEAMTNYHQYLINNLRQRMLREGVTNVEKFEYLLLRYKPIGLTELYHDLQKNPKELGSEESSLLKSINNMIEDKIIKYENDTFSFNNEIVLNSIKAAKEI